MMSSGIRVISLMVIWSCRYDPLQISNVLVFVYCSCIMLNLGVLRVCSLMMIQVVIHIKVCLLMHSSRIHWKLWHSYIISIHCVHFLHWDSFFLLWHWIWTYGPDILLNGDCVLLGHDMLLYRIGHQKFFSTTLLSLLPCCRHLAQITKGATEVCYHLVNHCNLLLFIMWRVLN